MKGHSQNANNKSLWKQSSLDAWKEKESGHKNCAEDYIYRQTRDEKDLDHRNDSTFQPSILLGHPGVVNTMDVSSLKRFLRKLNGRLTDSLPGGVVS